MRKGVRRRLIVNGGQIFILDKSPPWQRFHSSPRSIDNRPESWFHYEKYGQVLENLGSAVE